jgi:hypothetical protein
LTYKIAGEAFFNIYLGKDKERKVEDRNRYRGLRRRERERQTED